MPINANAIAIGTPAPDFTLPRADGAGPVSLADVATDAFALVVAFLCNHCPYVKNMEEAFAGFAAEYADRGLAVVAISSNELTDHPEDGPEGMVEQATRAGFAFPYLFDEDQAVAKAYNAACTPDLFLYDSTGGLAYHGQFDGSRPKNNERPTGRDLRAAADLVIAGEPVPGTPIPSAGCSMKWKPGNQPTLTLLVN